jgi:hypothetical protein
MIVYVKDPGVLGIVISEYSSGCVIKWFLDGIEFNEFLLPEEFISYEQVKLGGMDVI